MNAHALTPEQARAVARRECSLMVRAGAGTGKTTVLVERFVQAVAEDGAPVEGILAITFTEKAAAEMKTRVRKRFLELDRRADARAAEGAWISTIHGFCSRVLRTHALSAGIDPDFRVLDELEAERIATDAFDGALGAFMGEGEDPERLEMVAAYTPDSLRDMVRTAHSRLRSRGNRRPRLDEAQPPRIERQRERLETTARAAAADLGGAGEGKTVLAAIEKLERCLEVLERVAPGELADPPDLDKLTLAGNAKALCTGACDEYREALGDYEGVCKAQRQFRDHTLLRVLLELYGERYERGKRARSGLDFEDLELIARDLLAGDEGLRVQYAERFTHVLVDEFQDTNPLQNELIVLLERDNVFRVGDENQSIYGFRNADVEVFRRHWAAAAEQGRAESIAVNFRSRGELLEAIDRCFGLTWGDSFEPLREAEGARALPPRVTPCVELLVTDKNKGRWETELGADDPFGPAMHGAPIWRAAEARLLAKHIEQLRAKGGWEWRDIVLLLRATTSMGFYERALEERGIPTHVVGGRGYWSQQQVADLRHWLAALANPRDELAVYSVLASPLAGLSLDGVALIGLHARETRRDVWWTVSELNGLSHELPDQDRRRLERFVDLFNSERRAAPQVSLETLIHRAITETAYDQHVLSLPAGGRRMANVRKLMRMAREYEAEEGRDLRGFIDTLAERDAAQPREGEAPLEAEALDAVRLMTIHRAKGLEFPVVCVGDLGKDGREDYGALRISDDGSLGLRLASMGGGAVDSAELERIKARQKRVGEEEEKRIFYVAVTRAQEHLVLSGATDLEGLPPPDDMKEPMRWMLQGFAGEGVRRIELRPGNAEELLPAADRRPDRPEAEPAGGDAQPELGLAALPAPRALPVSRLSYTSLEGYRRCSYRFYLERALRLPRSEPPPAAEPLPNAGLSALLRGTLVHELLEELDFRRPLVPSEAEVAQLIESHGAVVRAGEVADLRDMVERFLAGGLFERIARAPRVRTELPFAFTLTPPGAGGRSLLLNGVVDVHAAEDSGLLVVDYKSDALEGRDPVELTAGSYATQRLVYALAGLRSGAELVEVVHCYLERPDEPAAARFEAADLARLEGELLELARGVVDGRFEPTAEPHRELCADCPGRPALCSWSEEHTLSER
ncbi:MAG TPA: UvrD-helicase domain-containing protein [Thermoleophilaceae bacterium]|nr:UvrD-helicase domain-containing protein [Thermoleophilaceae bacterium]